jgi:hypothetical protein
MEWHASISVRCSSISGALSGCAGSRGVISTKADSGLPTASASMTAR